MKFKSKKPVVFIVGPTAVGKSKIAVQLAGKLNAEIISADSMQIYRGMDIGTAKPTQSERHEIPHHMIDIISPSQNYSVYDYRKKALRKIELLSKKGKLPIVVGGTGLYIQALLEGLDEMPGRDAKLRHQLTQESKKKGAVFLHQCLKKLDPKRAKQIKSTDLKRIIRALEITRGRPKKKSKKQSLKALGYQPLVLGITRDRSALYATINRRVDAMFRKGLFGEVKALQKKRISKTASQAVGYKELLEVIENKISICDARERIKRNTRRLAKRQMTWFRKKKDLLWVDLTGATRQRDVELRIWEQWKVLGKPIT